MLDKNRSKNTPTPHDKRNKRGTYNKLVFAATEVRNILEHLGLDHLTIPEGVKHLEDERRMFEVHALDLKGQIDKLAMFIESNDLMPEGFEGGAVDCAIRILEGYADSRKAMKEAP